MNVRVSSSPFPRAHPPRSNPFLRSSDAAPFPCITPSMVTCVMVVSFMSPFLSRGAAPCGRPHPHNERHRPDPTLPGLTTRRRRERVQPMSEATDWGRRDRTVWHQMSGRPPEGAKGPLIIAEGDGAWVTDVEGNRYLDGLSGQWCVNAGYGRARLADAAAAQLKKLAFHPLTRGHLPAIELGERLEAMLGGDRATFYANSGSEANELAFKLVRQYHQLARAAAALQDHRPLPRLPRLHARRPLGHGPGDAPHRLRAARARLPARAAAGPLPRRHRRRRPRRLRPPLRRRPGAHDRVRAARDRGRGDHGADHHRRRHPDPARLLPARRQGRVRAPRRAADRRRGDLRVRPDREVVRARRHRRAARPRDDGQGHHERVHPARRDRREPARSSPRSPPTRPTAGGCATSTRSAGTRPAAPSRWRRSR